MAKTAVGLFDTSSAVDRVVQDLKVAGIAPDEVRVLREPHDMSVSDVSSTPLEDFFEALSLDLKAIGATDAEAQAYIAGVRSGGTLMFATGSEEQANAAVEVMNLHHAADVEGLSGPEPVLPTEIHAGAIPTHSDSAMTGRGRYSGSGARIFAW